MRITKTSIILAGIVLIGAAAPVWAQTHPLGDSLGKFDKDGDGKVSLAEWSADRAGLFKKVDANTDGAITLDEAIAYYIKAAPADDPKTQKRIDSVMTADANADGKVTRDELVAVAATDFKTRDADGDGFITVADKR
ncbi:hypothetical protein AEYBE204_09545 [Asticcacaulis sp. YBE204]|nr:hypothetical protein AEYBE204_09545 [Asticcacaulis sp. YBE204]